MFFDGIDNALPHRLHQFVVTGKGIFIAGDLSALNRVGFSLFANYIRRDRSTPFHIHDRSSLLDHGRHQAQVFGMIGHYQEIEWS